jgi:hypothetical protein
VVTPAPVVKPLPEKSKSTTPQKSQVTTPEKKKKSLSMTGFNSVAISPPAPPPPPPELAGPAVPSTESSLSVVEASVPSVSILDTTPPPEVASVFDPFHLPSDILNFDFKFEDDEEPAQVVPQGEPFDLLRQMFSGFSGVEPVVSAAPAIPEGLVMQASDSIGSPKSTECDLERKVYPPVFLLNVLSLMDETALCVPAEIEKLISDNGDTESPPLSDRDGSWRSSADPKFRAVATKTKTWKNSGYKPNGRHKEGESNAQLLHTSEQEGFW